MLDFGFGAALAVDDFENWDTLYATAATVIAASAILSIDIAVCSWWVRRIRLTIYTFWSHNQ
jgi:hypothetical protein